MKVNLLKAAFSFSGAVIFAGISGYLVYLLFKEEDEEDIMGADMDVDILKVLITERFKIPKEATGKIIGKQGSNVQLIQRETCTNINFSSNNDSEKFCIIRGVEENVEKAKKIILNLVKDCPNFIEIKFTIPKHVCGKVIGKGGSNIINIGKLTGARVFIERQEENFEEIESSTRNVTIKGNKADVEAAKRMVYDKVKEEDNIRNNAKKLPNVRSLLKQSNAETDDSKQQIGISAKKESERVVNTCFQNLKPTLLQSNSQLHDKQIDYTSKQTVFPDDLEFRSVYVTAVATPTTFWVQIADQRIDLLTNLTTEMTQYYKKGGIRPIAGEHNVVGKLVAAVHHVDNMIYRGRIVPRQAGDDPFLVVVYFLDFGDVELIHPSKVFDLKTHFLKLDFQAVECCLHGVDKIEKNNDEAMDTFEKLSHSSLFIPIKAKLFCYKFVSGVQVSSVELISEYNKKVINIGKELVARKLLKELNPVELMHNQLPDDVILET